MKEIYFPDYKDKLIIAGIPDKDIYDFTSDPLKSVYHQYFNWCVENLNEYSNNFGIVPSYFFYWNNKEINAYAGSYNGKYFIRYSTGYMNALHNKLGVRGKFFLKTNWTAFHNLQKSMNISLEYLMFQASTIFTFYHEFSHLVQKRGVGFKMNEYPNFNNYSFQSHLLEYDADLNGCQFVNHYIHQYIQDYLAEEHQTEANYKRLMYLGISSIIITQLLFLHKELYPYKPENVNTEFFINKSTHPHTFVRATYMIEHYVRTAKANNIPINFDDTTKNIGIICNEFFKDTNIFKDFIDGMKTNNNEIRIYMMKLHQAQKSSEVCIKHKINLFFDKNCN